MTDAGSHWDDLADADEEYPFDLDRYEDYRPDRQKDKQYRMARHRERARARSGRRRWYAPWRRWPQSPPGGYVLYPHDLAGRIR